MCKLCNDTEYRIIALLYDPRYTWNKGKVELTDTFKIPILAPCVCILERAANAYPVKHT